MQKKLILSLFLVLVISLSSLNCFANDGKKEKVVLEKNAEITDLHVLLGRAKVGIDESCGKSKLFLIKKPIITINTTTSSAIGLKSNEEVKIESFTTTQLLESCMEGDVTTNSYATTTFASAAVLSREDSGTNTGGDIGASSTIYWSESTLSSGGQKVPAVKLTKATGRWNIYQSGCIISNARVQGVQQGWRDPKGAVDDSQYNTPRNPLEVFNYTYNFLPVEEDSIWCIIGIRMKCDWTHGTSGNVYYFEFANCYTNENMS